ncbi:MAG: phosphoribosylamine--glycine ligase, partial [Myxococcota bacterium]
MRVVLVGNGGRETALAAALARSPSLTALHVSAPHPGWPTAAIVPDEAEDPLMLAQRIHADLVVIGPEAPLADGLADRLRQAGIATFGPGREAARLETSKAFTKEVCAAAGVATPRALVVDREDPDQLAAARARCDEGGVVVKADGLAAGKGVIVCRTADEAHDALDTMDRFGDAARRLVLEDRLEGPEVSVFALCDGTRAMALPAAHDHKALRDGNQGPNTGGMGAVAPSDRLTPAQTADLVERVHAPVIAELARRGHPFRGVLYGGFMLTRAGPALLEFNVRFGDPECQPLMTLWDDDVLPWLHGAAAGQLPDRRPRFRSGVAVCVVLASAGYPATSTKGVAIPEPGPSDDVTVYLAGAARDPAGVLRTAG